MSRIDHPTQTETPTSRTPYVLSSAKTRHGHGAYGRCVHLLQAALRPTQSMTLLTTFVTVVVVVLVQPVSASGSSGGEQLPSQPAVPELSRISCSTAISNCIKKSTNCHLVYHTYQVGCLKELAGRSPQGLCLDECRSSLISLSSLIEGFEIITCSCEPNDLPCIKNKLRTANCWPERLNFSESSFEQKRADFERKLVDFEAKRAAFEFETRAAFGDAGNAADDNSPGGGGVDNGDDDDDDGDKEPPDDPDAKCDERRWRCKMNKLCMKAYVQYGRACRAAIERRAEPCSAQCAASARVLYAVSSGGYFSCVCKPDDMWCQRQNHLIATKCFGFARTTAPMSAAAGLPAAVTASSPLIVWTLLGAVFVVAGPLRFGAGGGV